MVSGASLDTYVFLLAFAAAFLLGGKRPFLALSTRVLLVVLLGCALGFATAVDETLRTILGVCTSVANILFVAFAGIDFLRWQKSRVGE